MTDRKEDIIRVATQLFAASGYEGVSVRDICALANVSVAMVNYHFHNKEGLYRECVERLFRKSGVANAGKLAESVHDAASWREAVRTWVSRFSRVIHAREGDEALAGRIYRQEVLHASTMQDFILKNYARPVRKSLAALMRMAGLDESDTFRWTTAIWSLLSAYAIVDPAWRSEFRPARVNERKWSEQFAEFVCTRIFKELKYRSAICCCVLIALLAGCKNPGATERAESAHTFETNLIVETEQVLRDAGGTLTLSNAVALAHDRTLKLAEQDLETKLARITRATAFSAFLPTVAFTGSEALFSGRATDLPYIGQLETSGATFANGAMLVAQPVFTPVAWVMFAETQYGVRIKDIVRERAEQLVDIQVAALFYRAAVAERMVRTYELRLRSDEALTNRITRLAAEGYALDADRARAEARCAVDAARLVQARKDRDDMRAELADILRLWPLTAFGVKGDSLLEISALPEKPLEEWVWEGLVTRKDLYASDQLIELRRARVIEALAGFLPNVILGGGGANISLESAAVRGWAGSLTGTWAAFEGFRTVQQYRAARAEREAEFKLHEDRMLAVVVAVANAYRNLLVAREQASAAKTYANAARLDHAAAERRYAENEETLSSVLDKLTIRDDAEAKAIQAAYGEALAGIQLRQAVGIGLYFEKGKSHE